MYSVDNNVKNQTRTSKTISRYLNSNELNISNFEFIHNDADQFPDLEIKNTITHVVIDIPEPWKVLNKLNIEEEEKWISYLLNITQV